MRPGEVCWIRCQASCSISLGRIKTSIQRCRKWVMGSENEEDVDNIEFELSRYIWPRWRHGSLFQHVTYKFFSKKKAALGRKLSDGYSHSLQRDGNACVEGCFTRGRGTRRMTDTRTKDLAEFFIILCVFVPKPDRHQYSSHCPGSQPCYFRQSVSQSVWEINSLRMKWD